MKVPVVVVFSLLGLSIMIVSWTLMIFATNQQRVVAIVSDQEAQAILNADTNPNLLLRNELEKNLSKEFSKRGITLTTDESTPLHPQIKKNRLFYTPIFGLGALLVLLAPVLWVVNAKYANVDLTRQDDWRGIYYFYAVVCCVAFVGGLLLIGLNYENIIDAWILKE